MSSLVGCAEFTTRLIHDAASTVPGEVVVIERVKELLACPPPRLMTVAALGLIWTASSFIEALRTVLNKIYQVHSPPVYPFRRFLSIIQLFIIATLMLAGVGFLLLTPKVWRYLVLILELYMPATAETVKMTLQNSLIAISLSLFCSFLYYLIPNTRIQFKSVIPGGFVVGALWMLSGFVFSKYLTYYIQMNNVYGPLANIIITMIFFYVNNIIFIYGAELNYQLSYGK